MNTAEKNIDLLTEHFEKGCKANCIRKIGVELEHFIVDRDTKRTISYYGEHGVESVLRRLSEFFPDQEIYDKTHLIGMYNNDYSVTIEPAGQLEISIMPKNSIEEIRLVYESFRRLLDPVLREYHCQLITLGYHPRSKAADMRLIPKKRYEYMDHYFQTSGTHGINMMRGTASTQASIDYCSEEDFVLKYRMAYLFMPVLKLYMDNTPYFEGEKTNQRLIRTMIWDHVDSARCGIFPGLFDDLFGFESYAAYLYHMPLIFTMQGGRSIYTAEAAAADLWQDHILTNEEIDHILSMAFFDVRLKHYIEIRYADSVPKERMLDYVDLIRHIFLQQDSLEELYEQLPHQTESILQAQDALIRDGWDGMVYGQTGRDFLAMLQDL